MAFDFINKIGEGVKNVATKAKTELENRVHTYKEKLETISVKASEKRMWAGHTAAEASQLYSELYELGSFVKAHYYVIFEPYMENETQYLPLFFDKLSGYLVTETNLPILEAEYEETKVSGFYINSLSAMRHPDLQMTFLETADCRIFNSLRDLKERMINEDGTLNPPSTYAMYITIGMFSRTYGLPQYSKNPENYPRLESKFLVAPLQSSLDGLTSQSFEGLDVPISFKILRPTHWG
jgi:hypothetical protein